MRDLNEIPIKNVEYEYDEKNENYILFMPHKSLNHRIAQKLFKKPKITKVKVEGMGNDVWQAIDGKNSIEDIGKILKEIYQDEAEPLYERLSVYINNLEKNKFIIFK